MANPQMLFYDKKENHYGIDCSCDPILMEFCWKKVDISPALQNWAMPLVLCFAIDILVLKTRKQVGNMSGLFSSWIDMCKWCKRPCDRHELHLVITFNVRLWSPSFLSKQDIAYEDWCYPLSPLADLLVVFDTWLRIMLLSDTAEYVQQFECGEEWGI